MKLAEALAERSDINTRVSQLESRLMNNAKVQEGEQPAEDPEELMKELAELTARLEELMVRINLTNAAPLPDGGTLTAMLAKRDCMKLHLGTLRCFLQEASSTVSRGMRTEIRIRSTVDVRACQKRVDEEAKNLRELDGAIQALNWTTELL